MHHTSKARSIYVGTQTIWFVLSFIEVVLVFRFVLKLLGANPNPFFTNFVYSISDVLLTPFTAVFQPTYTAGTVFEWTTLLAAIVYFAIAAGLVSLLVVGENITLNEANSRLRNQE